ncbi:metallophosphoesterase [Halobacteria archaeon AArc-m2/3/4]|uniref:Phosphoesterase n=1 Tax=Natronoglomus mannanivorans TaxID=2979990 RepID=A0ABT2QAZ3_9EURY|nr:metallophosphoesterase [Halobacteria archaeon AArc-m2/3/4]
MIAIFSDTHSSRGHELEGPALEAVREAEAVIHAGDFNSEAALEAFQAESSRLYGVFGNTDSMSVRDRLPEARTIEHDGIRIAVTHRRDGGQTGLRMFGRSREAALVVSGHTHRPTVIETDDCLLLNPGSHADPRGNRPGYATLESTENGVEGRLFDLDGVVVETFEVES